ncbi:MAG: ribosome small subunit-dependent GTPase A [Bacteroidia bacterium]
MALKNGIVKKSTGSWYILLDDEGEMHHARLKGKFKLAGNKNTNPIAVGDHIRFTIDSKTNDPVIEQILPRRNYIIRKANNLSRQEHIIAANVDQAIIVATLAMPRTSLGFIDRILITAEAYEIPAIIVFNKLDIYDSEAIEYLDYIRKMYESLGYKTMAISVKEKLNLDELTDLLHGKTSLLTGHSGVGKSSLLNYFVPDLGLKTSTISEFSSKGKHTTTFAEMHVIDAETFIIDTPGIKEFGIVDMKKPEVSHFFPEMRALINKCRFNNCLHVNEPGCAVREAVENGEIYQSRYQTYLSVLFEENDHR